MDKPKCKLVGEDGNIFNLLGLAANSLRRAEMRSVVKEMQKRVFACKSYDEALVIIMEYVEVE